MISILAEVYVNGQDTTDSNSALWIGGIIAVAITSRIIAGRMDHSRIREKLILAGCEVVKIKWAPFGAGWFGERGDRIYKVRYRTLGGREVTANCKTSLFSGVYWMLDGAPTEFTKAEHPLPAIDSDNSDPTCPQCGKSNDKEARFCPYCGTQL